MPGAETHSQLTLRPVFDGFECPSASIDLGPDDLYPLSRPLQHLLDV
jgi:hypothetical protein